MFMKKTTEADNKYEFRKTEYLLYVKEVQWGGREKEIKRIGMRMREYEWMLRHVLHVSIFMIHCASILWNRINELKVNTFVLVNSYIVNRRRGK